MFIPNFLMVAARIQGSFTAALENEPAVTYQNYHDIPDALKGCEVSEILVVDGTIHLVLHRNTPEAPQGYCRGADGNPEIAPEQANTVRRIYDRFLAGDSLQQIANGLTADGIPTPMGKTVWQAGVVQSILSNEKYKEDDLLGKTYVEDCISKKVLANAGERPQYYVENNHPAIIDAATFARVQEELTRYHGAGQILPQRSPHYGSDDRKTPA